jgi:hypothetical protein
MIRIRATLLLCAVYGLLAFPLFYFVYKFGNPLFGSNDFFSYYKLYKSWDFAAVEAPFNMRLVSTYLVHLLHQTGLHYDTETTFDQLQMDRSVFFCAVFFNYLCVIATSVILFHTARRESASPLLSFCAGVVYLLGFGTIFYDLMPITDAFSVTLFAVVLHFYLGRSKWIFVPLLLLILQREYIFLAIGLVSLLDYLKWRVRYFLFVLLACILCFLIYYVMRKTIFYTPKYDFQASPGFFAESILQLQFPLIPFIKQSLMTMNLFILYFGIMVYKWMSRMPTGRFELLKQFMLIAQITVISIAAVFGNNMGRYYYILVPYVIILTIRESKPLLDPTENTFTGT